MINSVAIQQLERESVISFIADGGLKTVTICENENPQCAVVKIIQALGIGITTFQSIVFESHAEWINVKDKLPEEGQPFAGHKADYVVASVINNDFNIEDFKRLFDFWVPLPRLPRSPRVVEQK